MRTKLGAVLIIPSVAFLVLAGLQTSALAGQASSLGEFARQVGAGRQITAVIHDLQRERDRIAGEMAAPSTGAVGRYDPARFAAALRPIYETANRSIADFRRSAEPLARSDASWQVSYSEADQALSQLPTIRVSASDGKISASTALESYTRAIDALISLLAEPSPGTEHSDLTAAVLRYVQLARVKEIGSRARARIYSAARAGRYGPNDLAELSDLRAQRLTAIADFRAAATLAQIARYDEASVEEPFLAAVRLEETTTTLGGETPAVLDAETWWTASQQRHDLLRRVEVSVLQDAVDMANSRSADQLRQTLFVAGAVLAVLMMAVLTSVIIGRSVARSLRLLRAQALQVAQLELPEALERLRAVSASVPNIEVSPAAVRSMDEIGDVAEAFVAVHRSAVAVAVEQALMRRNVNAMFVNLARRSQVLVERQLELLDELEREESDPDQLDNLFKLDHLAARMRRNDDSLLVLAGTETSRRWTQPVALSAVMLAAVAEIEQYQRVRHDVVDQLHIVGHAVAELVHLLAELLENATAFSPPDTTVRISGYARGGDGAVIEIADEGLGMGDRALEEANAVLAAPSAADVAVSERMGLFVISHLAARQGVRVQLRAADRGLVAVVRLPAALVAPAPQRGLDYSHTRPMLAAVALKSASPTGAFPVVAGPRPAGHENAELPVAELPVAELPVAGRWPAGSPEPARRAVPTRAEDILAPASGTTRPVASAWWSRQTRPASAASEVMAEATPPATPVTGGISASGLPVRVPMAQLPAVTESVTPVVPAPREESDPEATGGLLSRFYGGVRRAEAEDTTEIVVAPAGARGEEER